MAEKNKGKQPADEAMAEKNSSTDEASSSSSSIPSIFYCTLSRVLLIDPVILSNGQTCERSEIVNLLKSKKTIFSRETRRALADTKNVTPDHSSRVVIHDWCREQHRSDLIQYDLAMSDYIRHEYFDSLHKQLASENLVDKRKAAKDLRKETTKWPYFRDLYSTLPDSLSKLIAPITSYEGIPEVKLELEDDLIAILMNITSDRKVRELIAESVDVNLVLVKALKSKNTETQRNAALAIFEMSGVSRSRDIIGATDAMKDLARMIVGDGRKLLPDDVSETLYRLFITHENKEKAVKEFADEGIFKKMEDAEFLDTLLPLLASLSRTEEGLNEIEKHDCNPLLRALRESRSAQIREFGSLLLLAVLEKGGSKWKDTVLKEEKHNGTISWIAEVGKLKAKKAAKEILELLNN